MKPTGVEHAVLHLRVGTQTYDRVADYPDATALVVFFPVAFPRAASA